MIHKVNIIGGSQFICLLLMLIFFIGCDKTEPKKETDSPSSATVIATKKVDEMELDSLCISVLLPSGKSMILNYVDANFEPVMLEFANTSGQLQNTVQKIAKSSSIMLMHYMGLQYENGKMTSYQHDYVIDTFTKELQLKYINSDLELLSTNQAADSIDAMVAGYKQVVSHYQKKNNNNIVAIKKSLDSLSNIVYSTTTLERINELLYLQRLSEIDPSHPVVAAYLENNSEPIYSLPLREIIRHYQQKHYQTCDFPQEEEKTLSRVNEKLYAYTVFQYLREIKHKNPSCFKKGKDWFTTTALYQSDVTFFNKELQVKNLNALSAELKQLHLLTEEHTTMGLEKVLDTHKSAYYLLDFWATWCGPCIEDFKQLKQMQLPNSVTVISLSLDSNDMFDKWKLKSNQLGHENSYLVTENEANKAIIKSLEVTEIPRYLLLDRKGRLIDFQCQRPSQAGFKNYIYQRIE